MSSPATTPASERRPQDAGSTGSGLLPRGLMKPLGWWVVGGGTLILLLGTVGGIASTGSAHPIGWLAGGAVAWSLTFITILRLPPWSLPLGVGAVMAIGQAILRSSDLFDVAVVVIVVATTVAFPFSPRRVRIASLTVTAVALLALTPTGSHAPIDNLILTVTAAVAVGIGYRLMGGVEMAIRQAEQENQMLLSAIEESPVVGLLVDFSASARAIGELPTERHRAWMMDPEFVDRVHGLGRIVWANDDAIRLFGFSVAGEIDLLGSNPSEFTIQRDLLEALASGERHHTVTAEVATVHEGSRWFHGTWVLPPSRPERCFLLAFDVTEVVEARRQLEQLIEDKNRFLATISHELRTPLTGVLGFSQEALEFLDTDTLTAIDFLKIVRTQAEDMSFIIEDLLTSARADAGTLTVAPRPVDVRELVGQLAATARQPVQLEAPSGIAAYADPGRLRQILRNLVSNAVRYGGDHRSLRVESAGLTVTIDVRNDGPPVPSEMVESIFQPYVSAHAPTAVTGSIGLGLAVSRQLARMMGGDLVYFREEANTVFRLTLPSAETGR